MGPPDDWIVWSIIRSVFKTQPVEWGRLIDDLLKFSRAGRIANKPTIVNFREVTQEIVEAHAQGLSAGVISVWIGEDMPIIMADKDRIHQVLDNLVVNAIK
jgi:light-regulated signal transduction histidine kinase (bacteriophytochrome)